MANSIFFKTLCKTIGGLIVTASLSMAHGAPKVLVVTDYTPPTSPGAQSYRAYNDYLKKETNGAMELELHHSGELASARTTLSALQSGVADIAGLITSYNPKSYRINGILTNLSFHNLDNRVVAGAIYDMTLNDCRECMAEYDKLKVYPLATVVTGAYHVFCAKEFQESEPSLKGLRTRVTGAELTSWLRELEAVPISMPNTDSYQALQTHALDCAMGSLAWLSDLSWQEVVKVLVNMPMGGYQGGAFAISKKTWTSLNDTQKMALRKAALHGMAVYSYAFIESGDQAVKDASKNFGLKIVQPSEEMIELRKKFMAGEAEAATTQAVKIGVKKDLAKSITERFVTYYDKWDKLVAENKNMDVNAYTDLLIKEILQTNQ